MSVHELSWNHLFTRTGRPRTPPRIDLEITLKVVQCALQRPSKCTYAIKLNKNIRKSRLLAGTYRTKKIFNNIVLSFVYVVQMALTKNKRAELRGEMMGYQYSFCPLVITMKLNRQT